MRRLRALDVVVRAGALACALSAVAAVSAQAQSVLPGKGWALDPGASSITFQTIKKGSIVETSKFASLHGSIQPDGTAEVRIKLESVDTGVDLRNVRMRFLFFETYKYPLAIITAKLIPEKLAPLIKERRMQYDLPFQLSLHGVEQGFHAPVIITLITDHQASVASAAPVLVTVKQFDLEAGLEKLREAVDGIAIVPSTSVSFNLVFDERGAAQPAPAPAKVATAPSGALESAGDLSQSECTTRFDVLSRTEAIYFATASARLEPASRPLLDTVVGIAERCPGLKIRIAGFTDSDGSAGYNQALSRRRAAAVRGFLAEHGVSADRLTAIGYGEAQPVFPNDSPAHKAKNRRIEFRTGGS